MVTDAKLAALLAAAGVDRSLADIDGLIRGVLAAPPGHDPDAWLDLAAPSDAMELRLGLKARLEQSRETKTDSLSIAERLKRVRAALSAQGVDGLILPLTDEHRNEYIPDAAQRLAWLTGFTGSAGVLIVLPEVAVVFVDGRYTVQAEQQLDPALFERAHLIELPPAKWIAQRLKSNQTLGFDPTLHVKAEVERYQKACARAEGKFIALKSNPVDEVWTGRPAQPIAPFDELELAYAGEAGDDKRRRMGQKVKEAGAELALISAPDSIAWLLNIRGGDVPYNPLTLSFALLHADGAVELFVDQRKVRPGQTLGNGVSIQPIQTLESRLDQLGRSARRVQVDPTWTNVALTSRLADAGAVLVDGDDPCIAAKAEKNPTEIEGARRAQRRDGAALCRFLCWLDHAAAVEDIDELAAASRLAEERRKDPLFRGLSFDTISAAGPNAALAHYRVTAESNRKLERGSLYLVDSGGQYLDATTDVTRTIAIGEPDAEMRQRFTLVLKGHIALDLTRFPVGTTGAQLDPLARHPLWQAGLDFDHGTGHGVGSYLSVHEGPARIAKSGAVPLAPGMILSNEPGYYKPGAYGIRIENLMVVVELGKPENGERELLGFEALSRAPIDRRLIDAALLTVAERAWVDTYHGLVRADLEGLLEGEARDWMIAATAPLA